MKGTRIPRRGLFVRIYDDPITAQKLEGIARLVRMVKGDDEFEEWTVKFVTNDKVHPQIYYRKICRPFLGFKTIEEAML